MNTHDDNSGGKNDVNDVLMTLAMAWRWNYDQNTVNCDDKTDENKDDKENDVNVSVDDINNDVVVHGMTMTTTIVVY